MNNILLVHTIITELSLHLWNENVKALLSSASGVGAAVTGAGAAVTGATVTGATVTGATVTGATVTGAGAIVSGFSTSETLELLQNLLNYGIEVQNTFPDYWKNIIERDNNSDRMERPYLFEIKGGLRRLLIWGFGSDLGP